MHCVIEVNRSSPSVDRLYEAPRRLRRCGAVCLAHVIPSGRAAEVEAGQRLLREAARALHRLDRGLMIEARLEIGDVASRLVRVAEEFGADVIVMAAHGEGDFPYLEPLGRAARDLLSQAGLPVLLVSPTGARLHRPQRASRRRASRPRPRAACSPLPVQ